MPIVSKPRQIRIDLDPDQGFPVALSVESIRFVEEGGEKIADLPAHIESLAPNSPQALAALGELASAAAAELLPSQAEVQRLAGVVATLEAQVAALQPSMPTAT